MNVNLIFGQLKEFWFNNKCEDEFQKILNDETINIGEREIKSLDYVRDTFKNFTEKHNYNNLDISMIEVLLNWGILMYMQIKEKLHNNETNI